MKRSGKSLKVEPIAIVGSALVSRPITSLIASETTTFSDVLVKAIDPSRPIRDSYVHSIEAESKLATKRIAELASARGWSPHRESPVDLYEQLDSLFHAKSILIAVA
jgi:hypothetical protein